MLISVGRVADSLPRDRHNFALDKLSDSSSSRGVFVISRLSYYRSGISLFPTHTTGSTL